MSDEASMPQLLACSRCDGPVNQEDLVEGIAVRVDGQPVCAVCIETLPPAVRVQINRVRALKGLAVTTYRMHLPRRPRQAVYTFTSAGLLLLHRRALIHGTDFSTPDLPAGGAPKPSARNPVTPNPVPKTGGKGLLIGALAGAALVVIGGLGVVLHAGPKSAATPASTATSAGAGSPTLASQSDHTQTQVTTAPGGSPPPGTVASTHLNESPSNVPGLSFSEYLTRHATTLLALQAAETDHAPESVIGRLLAQVISDRDGQLRDALISLRANQIEKTTVLLDAMPLPAERAEFAELVDSERALRVQLERRRSIQQQLQAQAQADAQARAQATTQAQAQAQAQAQPQPQVQVQVQAQTQTQVQAPAIPPVTVAPAPPTEPPPKAAAEPKPSEIDLQLWSGPAGPSPAGFSELDGKRKIPSPWPFFRSLASPRFIAAVKSRGADRKERYLLQLQFPAALVTNGGITLCIHPYALTRKEIAITVLEAPERPEQRENLGAGWKVIQIPAPTSASPTITLQLSDITSTATEPFWVGAVASSSGGLPSATELGLQTPGLQVDDPILAYKPLLSLLKATAAARGEARKWSDPKVLPFSSGLKILTNNDKQKPLVYTNLKARMGLTKVDNLLELVDVTSVADIDKLFVKGANPGLEANRPLVALMPQGAEAELHPDDWSRRVLEISSHLVEGPGDKVKGGWIPVWVIGRLDGKSVDTAVWSKVRNQAGLLLIDLTANPQPARGEELQACAQLAESLRTLTYQLQLVQIQQAGK